MTEDSASGLSPAVSMVVVALIFDSRLLGTTGRRTSAEEDHPSLRS